MIKKVVISPDNKTFAKVLKDLSKRKEASKKRVLENSIVLKELLKKAN